jgi:hypothetical protein
MSGTPPYAVHYQERFFDSTFRVKQAFRVPNSKPSLGTCMMYTCLGLPSNSNRIVGSGKTLHEMPMSFNRDVVENRFSHSTSGYYPRGWYMRLFSADPLNDHDPDTL